MDSPTVAKYASPELPEPWMRALIKLLFVLVLLALPLLAGIAYFALAERPLVTERQTLSHEDIARAKAILQQNDPRRLPAGSSQVIRIAPQDLNLAANYLLQKAADGKGRIALADRLMRIQATLHLPQLPMRNYVNIDAGITSEGGKPRITRLQIGSVPVPNMLSNAALEALLDGLLARHGHHTFDELIQDLRLTPDALQLTYRWDAELIDQARDTLLGDEDRAALRFYHDELVRLQANGMGRKGSLVELLRAMFAAAEQRSYSYDAIEENTALLTVLGTWASRQDLKRLVPGDLARPHAFRLKLDRRTDFAQHFLTSAALAARGDSTLSDAVGLFKEINDTDAGSGFSFTDIAADRAGTRFGALLTADIDRARAAQHRLAAGIAETEILPPVRDLPEHMHGAEFRQRFGHIGSPAYHAVMQEIERRIDACTFYRG